MVVQLNEVIRVTEVASLTRVASKLNTTFILSLSRRRQTNARNLHISKVTLKDKLDDIQSDFARNST